MEIEHWDPLIVFLVIGRLDESSYKAWEAHRTSQLCGKDRHKIPKWEQLKEFLDSQALVLMHAGSRVEGEDSSWESGSSSGRQNKGGKRRPAPYPSTSTGNREEQKPAQNANTKSGYPPCGLCGADHGLYKCEKFTEMNLRARLDYVKNAGLCEGCIKIAHPDRRCKTLPCRKCRSGKVHNTMLCPSREAEQQAAVGNNNNTTTTTTTLI